MFVMTTQHSPITGAYLYRDKPGAALTVVVCIGKTTIRVDPAEVPDLIRALDEAMEHAELLPADAEGTLWTAKLVTAPAAPETSEAG